MAPGTAVPAAGRAGRRPRQPAPPAAALPLALCRAAPGAGGRAVDGRPQLSAADRLRPRGGLDRRLRRADARRAAAGRCAGRQPAARRGARDGPAVRRPADRHRLRLDRPTASALAAAAGAAGRPGAAGRVRGVAAARSAAASAGRASELLAQHRRGRVGGARSPDQIWPVLLLNFGVGVFYVGPFMARAAAGRARQLSRRRAETRLRQSRLLGRHHRGQPSRLVGPGAPAHAARPSGRRRRSRRRADPGGAGDCCRRSRCSWR